MITIRSQPGQIVRQTYLKNPSQNRAGGMGQGIGPELKPQYCKNKTKQNKKTTIGWGWRVDNAGCWRGGGMYARAPPAVWDRKEGP
jgi:hypothetical protein